MQRICSLPVAVPLTDAQREEMSYKHVKAVAFDGKCSCGNRTCTTKDGKRKPVRLLQAQADGLHAYQQTGSGFFSIKVGGGKTGLARLIAHDYLLKNPEGRVLLLIPASVYRQFWFRDREWANKHLNAPMTFVGLGELDLRRRKQRSLFPAPACWVLPYSLLSTEDTIDLLRTINADLVICDEGQELRDHASSAKGKRWWSYVDRRDPPPKGVVMSGTLTTRTPMDYHRLIRWSLGPNSPLPRPVVEATEWSAVLRSGADEPTDTQIDQLRPLLTWANEPRATTQGFRAAYQKRLTSVPGFVVSAGDSIGVPLEIQNVPACDPAVLPGGETLNEMLYALEADSRGPNGDVLKFGVEVHNAARELSAGFYTRRFWNEADPMVEQAKQAFKAEQEYAKELNQFFKSTKIPREGLDTPMVVGNWHATRGAIKHWEHLYDLWAAWKVLQVEGLPERQSEPVRVCDYKIRHAVEWARKTRKGGILWVYHRAMAQWLFESLTTVGLRCILKDAGATWLESDGSEKYFCVASIEAHYRGKNLQHHTNQLLVQWPRPADYAEQLLGRCHRTGQQADRLVVHTNHTLDFDHEQMAATIADTVYDFETIGGERKLMIADWNPEPREYSEEFMRARGYARGQPED